MTNEAAALIADALAAPDARTRTRRLRQLAATGGSVPEAFDALARSNPAAALEYLAWLPGLPPVAVAGPATALLGRESVPLLLRCAAAGRLLEAVPDDPRSVSPVVEALTRGVGKAEALDRLLALARHVPRCTTLDLLIDNAEADALLRCPRCGDRLTRFQLIPHLWDAHGLLFHDGQAVEPRAVLAASVAAASADPTLTPALDESYAAHATYYPDEPRRLVFQALAAQGPPDAAEVEQLLVAADAERCGLCPVCLNAIPDPLPGLPPPAAVGGGRVAAEGFAVEVLDGPGGRSVELTRPRDPGEVLSRVGPRYSPRLAGVFLAFPLLFLGTMVSLALPSRVVHPALPTGITLALTAAVYSVGRYGRKPLADATTVALTVAWSDITPGLGRGATAVRVLTRLARASLGFGDVVARSPAVYDLVERAAELADRGPTQMQLLAAATLLQATDGAELGREKVAGLATVLRPFVRRELPPAYGEAAAELAVGLADFRTGERERLAVLVLADAFDAGLSAADIVAVARFLPHFRELLLGAMPDHLRLLQGVHERRSGRLWAKVGVASTVFEFADASPTESRRLLAAQPDALLVLELDPAIEAELGRAMLTARGLALGPVLLADPAAPIEVARAGDGLWRLQLGANRLALSRKPPERLVSQLRAWLRFHATVLLPFAERDSGPVSDAAAAILAPLVVSCPLCQTAAVHRRGRVGTPWQAIRPGG